MNTLHLYQNYIELTGFDTIKDKLYFHFLPSMHFSIMEKPSTSDVAMDIAYEVKDRKIENDLLLSFLKSLADKEIHFIYTGGIYLPVDVKMVTEEAFISFAKKINFSTDIL